MNRQKIELAGALESASAGSGTHASTSVSHWEPNMHIPTISALIGAFVAALAVEDVLPTNPLQGAATEIRSVIEALRTMTRDAIEAAISAPADAFGRVELLRQAVDFEGMDGPLVARCARALAEAVSPPAAGAEA